MKIEATASFYLWEGSSIMAGDERLEMTIKFNDPEKKIFKRQKIAIPMIHRRTFSNRIDFFEEVRHFLGNEDLIMTNIVHQVKHYFAKKHRKESNDKEFNKLLDITLKTKIKTTVEVDK